MNKIMKFTMCSVDHAICVSNTCRENLVVRATLPPERISTIPNAIDPSKFTPDPSARFPKGTINVVIMSRLVYRKGIDLVAPVVKVKFAESTYTVLYVCGTLSEKPIDIDKHVRASNLQWLRRVEIG